MGVKDSFMGASMMAKIAFALLFVANFFCWIAFTTTGWSTIDVINTSYGIWRSCVNNNPIAGCSRFDGAATDWVVAFQAFSIFGFVFVNVAFALVTLFIFVGKCAGNKEVSLATAITGIAGAITWLIAVSIFADKYDEVNPAVDIDLDYSFGLAIVSLVLSAVGGVLMIIPQGAGGSATKPSG